MTHSRTVQWLRTAVCAAAVLFGAAGATPFARADNPSLDRFPTNLTLLSEATEAALQEMFLEFTPQPGASVLLVSDSRHEAQWFVQDLLVKRLTGMGYQVYLHSLPTSSAPPPAAKDAGDAKTDAKPAVGPRRARRDSLEAANGAQDEQQDEPKGASGGDPQSLAEIMAVQAAADSAAAEADENPSEDSEPVPDTDYVFRYRVVECGVSYPKAYRTSPLGSRQVQRMALADVHASLLTGGHESVAWVGHGDAERGDVVPSGKLSVLEGGSYPFTKPTLDTKGLNSFIEPALVTAIVAGLIYLFYTNQN